MLAREAYAMIDYVLRIKAMILSPYGVFPIDNNAFCYSTPKFIYKYNIIL